MKKGEVGEEPAVCDMVMGGNKLTEGTALRLSGGREGGTATFAPHRNGGGTRNRRRAGWEFDVKGGKAVGESAGRDRRRLGWRGGGRIGSGK